MNYEPSTMSASYDSIIFDLDGTLWDSTGNVAEAWQSAKLGVDYIREDITRTHVRSITGMAYDAIFVKLFLYLSTEKQNEFKALCAAQELSTLNQKGGELYPMLAETLEELSKNYRLFIVSNCQSGYIEIFLRLYQMDRFFEGHQCYGTKNQPKAQNIQDIVADYQLTAPVYVGDTMGDHDAAHKAGVPFIFAAYGFGVVKDGYIARIDRFDELVSVLRQES